MRALQFEQKHDICTEESYSYTARDGSCRANGCSVAWPGSDIVGIREVDNSEDALIQAVAGRPVSIAVDAGALKDYNGGVLSDCSGRALDHAVLLVGYDRETLKVKNSWGTWWGESGYIRMQRGVNCCGLQNTAVYVAVAGTPSPSPWPTPTPSPSPSPWPTPSPSPSPAPCTPDGVCGGATGQCMFCKAIIEGVAEFMAHDSNHGCDSVEHRSAGLCHKIAGASNLEKCEKVIAAGCQIIAKDVLKALRDPEEVCKEVGECARPCCGGKSYSSFKECGAFANMCGCVADGQCISALGSVRNCCSGTGSRAWLKCKGGFLCNSTTALVI